MGVIYLSILLVNTELELLPSKDAITYPPSLPEKEIDPMLTY
jgi:hypothetical protein